MQKLSTQLFERKKRPIKIMQFGEGNFLRAFINNFIEEMNDKEVFNGSVVVVQPMPGGRVADLEDQDGLYTLFLQGLENGQKIRKHQVVTNLEDFINPFTQYDKYFEYAKSEDLEFVFSNTTEAGIVLDEKDTDFSKTPTSFPGKLLAFLEKRYEHFNGDSSKGLEIIPCELIDYNGDALKDTLIKLANIKQMSADFINWLTTANRFYNTLVDRIVPGYPKEEAQAIFNELGYTDNSLVVGEVFHLFVISGPKGLEEKFPANKAGLNVLFVEEIKPYKEQKVKILNGSHTCLVPVSYLAGIDTVSETIDDKELNKFVNDFIFNEVVPTINIPKDQVVSFANSVLERYANPFVRHELMSIALNSVTKFKTRILPTIIENVNDLKVLPKNALFSMAALMYFYRGKRGSEDIKLTDDQVFLDFFKNEWANFDESLEATNKMVTNFLGLVDHWEMNLNDLDGVNEFVTKALYEIATKNMREALKMLG